ncbi:MULTISPECIES: hypothetical protein [unclassified Francisella]|uniref:hypothetical protein n=1 Tax=unclassified Francisella TaxID=2610885 RepID=UPI002E3479AC|nr:MULTISPECIES: hypothetical protein [unclassified Francisella]MED7818909.1 hypothetical protein [Francisella sp. 19S2-4]MED7829746.1 hypothetical protein [Francisella sp. 19S2-10]
MIIGSVPIFCIVGGVFFGSFIVAFACIELKNITKAIFTKIFNKMPVRKKF